MKPIYLDNNATTQVDPLVKAAMDPFFKELYGNPSSLHQFGTVLLPHMKKAFDSIYNIIDAPDEDDVIITSCGTESYNTVVKGIYFHEILGKSQNHIITSNVEHPAGINSLKFLESLGASVTYLPVNKMGSVSAGQVEEAITDKTVLISIMWANNETGSLFPIHDIGEIAKKRGVLFHTDAVQAIGKVPVSVIKNHVDYLSFSGHKFHAPKGIGGLYIKKGNKIPPLFHGGEQMASLRGGTHNVPGIIGMGVAADLAARNLTAEDTTVRAMRDDLENYILNNIPDTFLNGAKDDRTPNTTNISFLGIEGEAILWDLNQNGIAASTGSACASESLEPSHVLRALNIDPNLSHTAIRFSLSRFNSREEIERVKEIMVKIVKRLRSISMSYKG
ncbi:MAG: aminotransferase class V-fold PLP-dependent enzyme [bacterium]